MAEIKAETPALVNQLVAILYRDGETTQKAICKEMKISQDKLANLLYIAEQDVLIYEGMENKEVTYGLMR